MVKPARGQSGRHSRPLASLTSFGCGLADTTPASQAEQAATPDRQTKNGPVEPGCPFGCLTVSSITSSNGRLAAQEVNSRSPRFRRSLCSSRAQ